MSAPLWKTADVGEHDKPWVSALTTPVGGGAWLICVNVPPEKHGVYRFPYADFTAHQASYVAKTIADIIGARLETE